LARFRSPLPALIAALALAVQLLAISFHHPIATLSCAQADDSSAPSVPGRAHCDDDCPLCQFAGHATPPIVPPFAAALGPPARSALALVAEPESVDPKPQLNALAQARAPPLAV
jgi:hypothetical protein